ncbi:hypothetical protein [Streptomyces alanosinicus]|uniref:Uncharacterized protein n=1 Tax=Streptomyces alanosinicus TaxID=68171 RepID=A0A918YJ74_9ACTN|nr:hypothetical protein [Streptomyces alanosinicus]GHE05045.1 hypothetical protein GCM10010339_39160 [Streptomyces alanosinicus]
MMYRRTGDRQFLSTAHRQEYRQVALRVLQPQNVDRAIDLTSVSGPDPPGG